MKISSISDVHITNNFPERLELFKAFCKSSHVLESDIIILLGDIFDHMVCHKKEYIKKYRDYFSEIENFLNLDKKLYIVEGNHDFHTEAIYKSFIQDNCPDKFNNYFHLKLDKILNISEKQIYIGHGDILDYNNKSYRTWKNIYSSKTFELIVKYLFPFRLIESLGQKASSDSKKRNKDSFNYERNKKHYRDEFEKTLAQQSLDIAITGHTHILENYEYNNCQLINNGFFPETKSFIHYDGTSAHIIKLEGS